MATQKVGYWGPVTATLDWCEANYQFSHYIAEFANTFSNLFCLFLAFWGFRSAQYQRLPFRYAFSFAGFALVSIGSFFFHASLLFEAQLCDELPMIYVASYTACLMFDTEPGFTMSKSSRRKFALTFLFQAFFTWSYYLYRNPIYHQIVFASLIGGMSLRPRYIFNNSPKAKTLSKSDRSACANLFIAGLAWFAFAFFIWNLDNIFCTTLTRWKVSIGWPTAFLLEGHSWWHFFTGIATWYLITGVTYLCVLVKDDPKKYRLQTNALFLPYVQAVDNAKLQ